MFFSLIDHNLYYYLICKSRSSEFTPLILHVSVKSDLQLYEIQIKGGDLFFMDKMTKLKFIKSLRLSNKNKKMIVKIKIIIAISVVNE